MKKNVIKMIGAICSFVLIFAFGYWLGHNHIKSNQNNNKTKTSDIVGKIDYPLIDINFDNESEWVIINRNNLFTEQETFNVAQNNNTLQLTKENLSVITFPVGRGTTPNGIIYVYKNGKLVKEVPYIEVMFENESLTESFLKMTKEEVENLIQDNIPSPI